jgi:Putative adhesin
LNEIRGDVDIQTSLKEVLVTNLEGKCAISNEYADVRVSAQTPLENVDIKNRNGEIELFLPEQASFAITATAKNGKINTEYPGLAPAGLEGGAAVLRSQMRDGGPRIILQTQFGNIRISRTAEGGKGWSATEGSTAQRRPRREYRRSFSMEAPNPRILTNFVRFCETFLGGAR